MTKLFVVTTLITRQKLLLATLKQIHSGEDLNKKPSGKVTPYWIPSSILFLIPKIYYLVLGGTWWVLCRDQRTTVLSPPTTQVLGTKQPESSEASSCVCLRAISLTLPAPFFVTLGDSRYHNGYCPTLLRQHLTETPWRYNIG